jgi:hypothetical protein
VNLRNKIALCLDHGLYIYVARKLAETFGTVLYYAPWTGNGFPSEKQRQIGSGIPGITRVEQMWSAAREADLIVVADIYYHDEIAQLRAMGKPVWGAGYAEALEIERGRTKELMAAEGMDVVPYKRIIGAEALREYLADINDAWIKSSVTRGDFETMHWQGEHLSGAELDKNIGNLGPRAKTKEFIVEPSVPGCEFGYDGYTVDGRFGRTAMFGPEDKDAGYIGTVCDFERLPDAIRIPTLQFGKIAGMFGCRGFHSNEIRIAESDGTPYLIDPTMRCGSPPSESYIEIFSNWAEVIWAGANGEVIDLEPEAKFAAQIVLKSDWVTDDEYLPVDYPEEIARWVKLHNYCILDGRVTVAPQDFPEFGSVVGLGDTKEEAEQAAKEHVEQVRALHLSWKKDVFNALDKCLEEGAKLGIDFPKD